MPNEQGEITNADVRKMRELRGFKLNNSQVARLVGVSHQTVARHIGPYHDPDHVTVAAQRRLSGLRIEAERYTAFVERAAFYGCPVLSSAATS